MPRRSAPRNDIHKLAVCSHYKDALPGKFATAYTAFSCHSFAEKAGCPRMIFPNHAGAALFFPFGENHFRRDSKA